MAAYHRVYDSPHLQADCQAPGSAPKPYARQSSIGYLFTHKMAIVSWPQIVLRHFTSPCVYLFLNADYDDSVHLSPVTAHVGQTVALPCSTTLSKDVDWKQTSVLRGEYVYSNGVMYEDFRYRFVVDRSVPRFYNLTITNVQLNDSAQYICIEDMGHGRKHYHTLNVTGYSRYHILYR